MNKWRLLLFSVFGLLQITTSDRNFINGRYSCCDRTQRYSEPDTRVIAYEPYRLYRDVPDLQERKFLGSHLLARGQRGQLLQDRSYEREAYDQRLSRERNYDFRHFQQDESRPERFGRNRGKLILHSRFIDVSRYAQMFNNDDRVNRKSKNMRRYDTNNNERVRSNLDRDLRNNERLVRENRIYEESVIKTSRDYYTKSISENRLQPRSRNTEPIIRDDQRLLKRNTQTRISSESEENIRLVPEYNEVDVNEVDRRIAQRSSSRHSTSEQSRRERGETRKRDANFDSERLLDVRRQVFTQLKTTNTIARHIKHSRKLNHLYDTDNYRIISRESRSVRSVESRGNGQIITRGDRHERDVNIISTKRDDREVIDIRRERNEHREHRVRDNSDSKQNGNSFRNIRDMQKIRGSPENRFQRIVLREQQIRESHDDRDRSTNLLILTRYRYGESESENNRNRILRDDTRDRFSTRQKELVSSQTGIRREKNVIRDALNRQLNVRRQDNSMIDNSTERNNRKVTDVRQEREALRGETRVSRCDIRRHERYSSRLPVRNENLRDDVTKTKREENIIHEDESRQARYNIRQVVRFVSRDERQALRDLVRVNRHQRYSSRLSVLNENLHQDVNKENLIREDNSRDVSREERQALRGETRVNRRHKRYSSKLHQDVTDVKHEENIIREDEIRQGGHNIRQLVRDVSRVNIRNKQTRERDDARRERREVRENSVDYTQNIRRDRSASRSRTITTLRRLDVQRTINGNNDQSLKINLENAREKEYFRYQERDMSRRQRNNDRTLNIHNIEDTSRNMREVNNRDRSHELSVRREPITNVIRNNRDNLAELGENSQRMHKRQNVRQALANDNTLNIDDRVYNRISVRQNGRDNFRNSGRNIRQPYNVQTSNRLNERPYLYESQTVDYTLSFRRDVRYNFRIRSALTNKNYRTRENNEGLSRTIQERLHTRTNRDEYKIADHSEESRQTRPQIVTESRETRDRRESFNIRNIREDRNGEDNDARRDLRRTTAITDDRFRTTEKNIRFIPMTYKPGTLTFEMKWQHLFYALQAIYLLSLITKVPKDEEGKNKLRIITWLTPAKTVKMD